MERQRRSSSLDFFPLGGQQNKPWTSVKAMGWVAQMFSRQLGNETKLRGALWITFSLRAQEIMESLATIHH